NTSTPLSTSDSLFIPNATQSTTYILQVISSVQGCYDYDNVFVNVLPAPEVDAGPTFTVPVYSTVTIGGNPTAFGNVTVAWIPTLTLNDPTAQNPVASNTTNVT